MLKFIIFVVAAVAFAYYAYTQFDLTFGKDKEDFNKNYVACTMEAKICPDGSTVGRSGPNCEFDPCPGE